MKKITTTHKVSFGAVLVLMLFVVGYGMTFKHIDKLRQDLLILRQQLANEDAMAEKKQGFVSLLEDTKQGREELSHYLVPLDDPTPFLELIESIARDTGVVMSVEKLDVVSDKETDMLTEKNVKVVLSVEGAWQEVYHYISLLEVLPYVVTITESAFSVEELEGVSIWKGQIHLNYTAR